MSIDHEAAKRDAQLSVGPVNRQEIERLKAAYLDVYAQLEATERYADGIAGQLADVEKKLNKLVLVLQNVHAFDGYDGCYLWRDSRELVVKTLQEHKRMCAQSDSAPKRSEPQS